MLKEIYLWVFALETGKVEQYLSTELLRRIADYSLAFSRHNKLTTNIQFLCHLASRQKQDVKTPGIKA